jgi:hypothetical protein
VQPIHQRQLRDPLEGQATRGGIGGFQFNPNAVTRHHLTRHSPGNHRQRA